MMMTTEDPHFEIEINYTKPVIKSMVFELNKPLYKLSVFFFLFSFGGLLLWQRLENNLFWIQFEIVSIIFWLGFPLLFFLMSVTQANESLKHTGSNVIITLTNEIIISKNVKNGSASELPWGTFYSLKRTKAGLIIYLNKYIPLYLPTDQLSPEAQAFIIQKLTECNVPIKG